MGMGTCIGYDCEYRDSYITSYSEGGCWNS